MKARGNFIVEYSGYVAEGVWTGRWSHVQSDDPEGEYEYELEGYFIDSVSKYDEGNDTMVPVDISDCPDGLITAIEDECDQALYDCVGRYE